MEVCKATRIRSDDTWCIPNREEIMVSKKSTFTFILIDLKIIFFLVKFYNFSIDI